MIKKILITGSEGFLGTYLKNYYLKKNFEVVGLDNLSKYKFRSNTVNSNNKFSFHKVDCSKERQILKYLKTNNITKNIEHIFKRYKVKLYYE